MARRSHPIVEYLHSHPGLTQAELARRAKVPQQRICDVLAGRVIRFSPEAAERLQLATNGELKFADLMLFRRRAKSTSRPRKH
jgi:predicted transcriptional regulator